MYSSLTGSVAGLKVISEEHDVSDYSRDRIASTAGAEFLPSVVSLIPKDEFLPLDELTVWIDPLDATKEYTGIIIRVFKSEIAQPVSEDP